MRAATRRGLKTQLCCVRGGGTGRKTLADHLERENGSKHQPGACSLREKREDTHYAPHGAYHLFDCLNWTYRLFTSHSNRLWNLARETFAPVWSLSKLFILTNLVMKSLQKIRLENIQNRRPHGSSIKHGGFWDFWMCRASADDQSPDIPFRIGWILGNSIRPVYKPRFRGPKSINQSTGCSYNSTTQY